MFLIYENEKIIVCLKNIVGAIAEDDAINIYLSNNDIIVVMESRREFSVAVVNFISLRLMDDKSTEILVPNSYDKTIKLCWIGHQYVKA